VKAHTNFLSFIPDSWSSAALNWNARVQLGSCIIGELQYFIGELDAKARSDNFCIGKYKRAFFMER
jgi:hypothetical protein